MRFTLTREFYIPENSQKIVREGINAEVYIQNSDVGFYAMGFEGKKNKPSFNYPFRSLEQMNKHIEDFFKSVESYNQRKIEKRTARKEFKTSLKKDDILYGTWGYDQTNVEFYQIIEILEGGKSARIRKIAYGSYEETGYMSGTCKPAKDAFLKDSKVITKRIAPGDYISFPCFSLHKWSGESVSWSSYA